MYFRRGVVLLRIAIDRAGRDVEASASAHSCCLATAAQQLSSCGIGEGAL